MVLELLPLEEDDIPAMAGVTAIAFNEDGLTSALYPSGYTEANHEHYIKQLRHGWHGQESTTRINKIVDTSLPDDDPRNKIISIAKWSFNASERSEAEPEAEEKKGSRNNTSTNPGMNEELYDAFQGEMVRHRREIWQGKPYILLHFLATLPQHHRRGAGARHLQWGIAAADQLNLPVWLEASAAGRPLYGRYGFEVVNKVNFDAERWGLSKDFVAVNMLRPASSSLKT